jgi:hypothetical protein
MTPNLSLSGISKNRLVNRVTRVGKVFTRVGKECTGVGKVLARVGKVPI